MVLGLCAEPASAPVLMQSASGGNPLFRSCIALQPRGNPQDRAASPVPLLHR
ncbi:MAG: hypothetical protein F6J99_22940 [Moorea sp. SIO4G3]|nr:hypothetical protein [Moorena sp. SIO4G3]